MIPIVIGALETISKGLVKGLQDLENQRKTADHPDYSIVKTSQNTDESPGDM